MSLAGVSGQLSISRVQAHMECLSFISTCFIEWLFGACSGSFFGLFLQAEFFSLFQQSGCFGAVLFSISPPTLPSIFLPLIQSVLTGAWNGGSWLGWGDLPAMGAVFYLGAGCQQWKPLDTPGTHLPF